MRRWDPPGAVTRDGSDRPAAAARVAAAAVPGVAADADALLHVLVQIVHDYAVFLLDPGGHVMSWNAGAARMKGWAAHEIVGRHFSCFYLQEAIDRGWPAYELECAARDGRFEDEGWRLRKDGGRFWANVVITALRDADGTLRAFGKVTRDLTERRAAERRVVESEQRHRLLVEQVQEYAIMMLDADGRVLTWNDGARRLHGWEAAEVVGRHFALFHPPDALAAGAPARALDVATREGRLQDEGWRVRKDGTPFWANVVLTAVHDHEGRLQGFAEVTRDMTERRRNDLEIRRLNTELSERVDALARTNERLRAASLENEAFVFGVSHDLRGPLVNLHGFGRELSLACARLREMLSAPDLADPVRAQARALLDEDVAESLRYVESAVAHLGGIIDGMLRLARTGRVEYRMQPIDVGELVARVVRTLSPDTAGRGVAVVVEPLRPAWGDPSGLEQLFGNLIGNAIKYLDPARPGRVTIGHDPASETEGTHVYVVRDNGLGVAPDDVGAMFEPFRRLHADVAPGDGMGLAIVRRIVQRHGGTVRAESARGEGTAIYVGLPAVPPGEGLPEGHPR